MRIVYKKKCLRKTAEVERKPLDAITFGFDLVCTNERLCAINIYRTIERQHTSKLIWQLAQDVKYFQSWIVFNLWNVPFAELLNDLI